MVYPQSLISFIHMKYALPKFTNLSKRKFRMVTNSILVLGCSSYNTNKYGSHTFFH